MEGLEYGWHKSLKQYHYYPNGDFISLCSHSRYTKSEFKSVTFLAEVEITANMRLCQTCRHWRQEGIKHAVITEYKKSKPVGFWDDKSVCPNCKTPIMFFNSSKSNEHLCTVCNEMVVLQ